MPRVDLSHVTVDTVSVSEAVAELIAAARVASAPRSFRALVRDCRTRMEVIVRFLALLELCKMGRVTLGQGTTFGDLQIAWLAADDLAGACQRPRPGRAGRLRDRRLRGMRSESPWRRTELGRTIEAILLVAVEPLPPRLLAELLEEPVERVEEALDELARSYERERRGFVLARIAGGARLQTHPDLAPYVERFANREVSHRLSTAALETLAIVAYRQPVSRARSPRCAASTSTG